MIAKIEITMTVNGEPRNYSKECRPHGNGNGGNIPAWELVKDAENWIRHEMSVAVREDGVRP